MEPEIASGVRRVIFKFYSTYFKEVFMKIKLLSMVATLLVSGSAISMAESAQDSKHTINTYHGLPLSLAIEAAQEAIRVCEKNGYQVTATIVDSAGLITLQAKGDGSAVHTKDSSYGKAYTIASMGRVFNFDTTGQFANKLKTLKEKKPELAAVADIKGILPLAGGVAFRAYGKVIGGIGIGGAPGGEKDEVCATAGVNKVKDRLPQ